MFCHNHGLKYEIATLDKREEEKAQQVRYLWEEVGGVDALSCTALDGGGNSKLLV
jgi:hypothetical protein